MTSDTASSDESGEEMVKTIFWLFHMYKITSLWRALCERKCFEMFPIYKLKTKNWIRFASHFPGDKSMQLWKMDTGWKIYTGADLLFAHVQNRTKICVDIYKNKLLNRLYTVLFAWTSTYIHLFLNFKQLRKI